MSLNVLKQIKENFLLNLTLIAQILHRNNPALPRTVIPSSHPPTSTHLRLIRRPILLRLIRRFTIIITASSTILPFRVENRLLSLLLTLLNLLLLLGTIQVIHTRQRLQTSRNPELFSYILHILLLIFLYFFLLPPQVIFIVLKRLFKHF